MSSVRLDQFDHSKIDRGRPRVVEMAWILVKCAFFTSNLPWSNAFKRFLLRCFGAKIGAGVVLRPRINIHFPWKLTIGDHCWLGDGCQILNIAPFEMQTQSALAHEVYIAAAGHDIRSATMAAKNEPILIKSGTWVASRAFIAGGVTIEEDCVIAAGAVVTKDVPKGSIVAGNPGVVVKERVIDRA
jgi:putative colanic acid biosynthesis acetyltransferase WcaF